jgi:hypothetical protein
VDLVNASNEIKLKPPLISLLLLIDDIVAASSDSVR